MQSVGGRNANSGVRVLMPPPTQASAEDDASPAGSSAAQKGSGRPDPRAKAARSPLAPGPGEYYAKALDWPVKMVGGTVHVECGIRLDVVVMPEDLGKRVNQLLRTELLRVPIMAMLGADAYEPVTWGFFCEPRTPHGQHAVITQLAAHDVVHFGAGAALPLPPSVTCGSRWIQWVVPPPLGRLPSPLPPWSSVVSCALRVTRKPLRI
jgi:hypothetical protein